MGLFKNNNSSNEDLSNEEIYGIAWLMIVNPNKRNEGFEIMRRLEKDDFIEAAIALSMFETGEERKRLIEKAARAGNSEGVWQMCAFISKDDPVWEKFCIAAAESGCVDAMLEMGNIYHRRKNYAEAMYWYVLANTNDHPEGPISRIGLAKEWYNAGCPREFVEGSQNFDYSKFECAMVYLDALADTGEEYSLDHIMALVFLGEGVPISGYLAGDICEERENYELAVGAYNAMTFENDAHAFRLCADMYYYGKGVEQDKEKAKTLYLHAAEMGDRTAMFCAGQLLSKTNKYLAAYWYGVSHVRGYEHSLNRLIQLSNKEFDV